MGSHSAKSRQESGGVWTVICPGKQHFANLLDSSRPARGLLHTEEVTGSIPVSPTDVSPGQKLHEQLSSYSADGSCRRIGRNLGDQEYRTWAKVEGHRRRLTCAVICPRNGPCYDHFILVIMKFAYDRLATMAGTAPVARIRPRRRLASCSLMTRSGSTRRGAWRGKGPGTCVSGPLRLLLRVTWLLSLRLAASPPSLNLPGGSGPPWLADTGPPSCCLSTTQRLSSARAWRPSTWSASALTGARTGPAYGRPRRRTRVTPGWNCGWPLTGTRSSAGPRAGSIGVTTITADCSWRPRDMVRLKAPKAASVPRPRMA